MIASALATGSSVRRPAFTRYGRDTVSACSRIARRLTAMRLTSWAKASRRLGNKRFADSLLFKHVSKDQGSDDSGVTLDHELRAILA